MCTCEVILKQKYSDFVGVMLYSSPVRVEVKFVGQDQNNKSKYN